MAQTLALFKASEQRIRTLTQEYTSQGMSQIKASFVAMEIVKHHDKHGTHMPTKQIDFVKTVGDYVHKNYNDLRKFGFSYREAAVTFNEGAIIVKQSNKLCAIAKSDIKQIQITSKQQLESKFTQDFTVKNHQKNLSSLLEI